MSNSKYILPYHEDISGWPFRIRISNNARFSVWAPIEGVWRNHYCVSWIDTKEEAMADLDKRLIEDGYILLTEEQALLV